MIQASKLAAVLISPIGKLGIEIQNEFLIGIHFLSDETKTALSSSPLALETDRQLSAYFNKKLFAFDLPLLLEGTPFQQTVLHSLRTINFGQTKTYGSIAKELNSGPRAVGNACRRNPIPIIIPCHRVVAQHHIGGYSGAKEGRLLNIKIKLLQLEKMDE